VPPTTVTTVASSTVDAATSTIVLAGGACVFSPCVTDARSDLRSRHTPLRGQPGQRNHELPDRTDARQPWIGALVSGGRSSAAELGDRVRWHAGAALWILLEQHPRFVVVPDGQGSHRPRRFADNHLLWRTAGAPETRTDISFLEQTDVAAYHPAGPQHLRRRPGDRWHHWAVRREQPRREPASDRQKDADPNTIITEIGPDPSGALVYFVDDHRNGTLHIHAVALPSLTITNVTAATEPIARLTIGTVASAAIGWRIGDCAGLTRTQIFGGQAVVDQPTVFAALSTEPIGWLDTEHLVVSVRPTGCTGPSDLWVWNTANSAATPLITGVDSAGNQIGVDILRRTTWSNQRRRGRVTSQLGSGAGRCSRSSKRSILRMRREGKPPNADHRQRRHSSADDCRGRADRTGQQGHSRTHRARSTHR